MNKVLKIYKEGRFNYSNIIRLDDGTDLIIFWKKDSKLVNCLRVYKLYDIDEKVLNSLVIHFEDIPEVIKRSSLPSKEFISWLEKYGKDKEKKK